MPEPTPRRRSAISPPVTSDPQPPPPPKPFPFSFSASGAPPASAAPVPTPPSVSNLAPQPGHNIGLASSSAQPPPLPPPPVSQPHLPLPTPSSTPLLRNQRPAPSSDPQKSAPPPQQLSYAQAARSSRGPSFVRAHASAVESFAKIPRTGINIISGSKEGMPSFSFVSTDLPRVEEIYSNALVMKFSGGRPSLEASHKEILSWGMENQFSIGPLSSRAFLLRFLDGKDLLKVLTRPSSLLITFPYKIFRWHNLCHIAEDSCLAPVWISLPRLPLQCFVPEFLESVGNKLGKFLCFDRATTTLTRPSAARICVELDLRKPPPPFIWVGLFDGFKQQIIYERLPKYCNGCHRLGHSSVECSKTCVEHLPSQSAEQVPNQQSRPPPARRNAYKHTSSNPRGINTPPKALNSALPANVVNPPLAPNPAGNTSTQVMSTDISNNSTSADIVQLQDKTTPQAEYPSEPHPKSPNKALVQSKHHKSRHKKKLVSFGMQRTQTQSNLNANQEFWNAVNTQMAVIAQDRLNKITTAPPEQVLATGHQEADIPPPSTNLEASLVTHSSDESSGSSIAADSPPPSPNATRNKPQHQPTGHEITTYDSEGEDRSTEPSNLQGHNTDELLDRMPQSSKRNKRHPDQPLQIQLRVRKDPSASHL